MPLLPPEPFLYPDGLLADSAPPSAAGRWWVLHTRPRAEKVLARSFFARRLAFFLPLYKRQWRNSGHVRRSHIPLFPGYVFLHGDAQTRVQALETNLLARVLPVEDQATFHADLARVHRLMTTDLPLEPEDRLPPGTLVEVTGGPLAGLCGKVLRRGKQLKLVVEIEFLQRGVSVEMDGWTIQPLAGPAATAGRAACG
jgi:transcriptional antiterminator RfaH